MDFATMGQTLAKNDGIEMHLVGPDGVTELYAVKGENGDWSVTSDPDAEGALPCVFTVVGQDSRAYRRRKHELVDALRARQKVLKSAQIETEAMKMVAAGVTGWSSIPWEGELLEFSDDNLLKFLDLYRPAFDQTNEFIGDRTNFLRVA
ncbi:hypothetical protein [Pseudodonghicola flavimaris]|uniref:Uncharacterized protein n=1 Tax=Pseudodonghicola flavimaris TaxID=3050036 RepID=A0ABT7EW29_9RHOB|nr:hypothetical protein [Pseudodonghicola flavimaris]MDK3016551.1 hypothetical protein [Pseudodonghicola flavimaris]